MQIFVTNQSPFKEMEKNKLNNWQRCKTQVFWGEIAPTDHVLQIYENDEVFLDALSGFVGAGINAGDCVIVIATDPHLKSLEKRLTEHGIYVRSLIAEERYIPLNAEKTLELFMVNGWPDEEKFNQAITNLFQRASCHGRKIRAFGEMVALLWKQGHNGATVHLEHLWNKVAKREEFTLFCAYPKSGFTKDITDSINHICCTHSKMIDGSEKQIAEVIYRSLEQQQAV